MIDLNRLNTFLLVERFKMETSVSIRAPLIAGEWVSSLGVSDAYIHILIHPKLKEVPKVLSQVTGVRVHPPSFWPSHGPTGLYNDCKGSETDCPDKGNQTLPIPGRLTFQDPVSERSTSEHSDSGRPDTVFRVDNKSGEIRTKTYLGVFVLGLQIPPRFSPCKTHSREMAQSSGFEDFDCKMFDAANWFACLKGETGPGETPSPGILLHEKSGRTFCPKTRKTFRTFSKNLGQNSCQSNFHSTGC